MQVLKISDVIAELEKLQAYHGDLPVKTLNVEELMESGDEIPAFAKISTEKDDEGDVISVVFIDHSSMNGDDE